MQGFFHGTGHGLGLQIHEAPSIGKRPSVLRAGHVVTVEPGPLLPRARRRAHRGRRPRDEDRLALPHAGAEAARGLSPARGRRVGPGPRSRPALRAVRRARARAAGCRRSSGCARVRPDPALVLPLGALFCSVAYYVALRRGRAAPLPAADRGDGRRLRRPGRARGRCRGGPVAPRCRRPVRRPRRALRRDAVPRQPRRAGRHVPRRRRRAPGHGPPRRPHVRAGGRLPAAGAGARRRAHALPRRRAPRARGGRAVGRGPPLRPAEPAGDHAVGGRPRARAARGRAGARRSAVWRWRSRAFSLSRRTCRSCPGCGWAPRTGPSSSATRSWRPSSTRTRSRRR